MANSTLFGACCERAAAERGLSGARGSGGRVVGIERGTWVHGEGVSHALGVERERVLRVSDLLGKVGSRAEPRKQYSTCVACGGPVLLGEARFVRDVSVQPVEGMTCWTVERWHWWCRWVVYSLWDGVGMEPGSAPWLPGVVRLTGLERLREQVRETKWVVRRTKVEGEVAVRLRAVPVVVVGWWELPERYREKVEGLLAGSEGPCRRWWWWMVNGTRVWWEGVPVLGAVEWVREYAVAEWCRLEREGAGGSHGEVGEAAGEEGEGGRVGSCGGTGGHGLGGGSGGAGGAEFGT